MPGERGRAAALLLLLSLLAIGCGRAKAPSPPPPNVLLIVMDTTRGDRCSFDGYPLPTTPRLAAIGREGTVYANAWTPSPWTAPAHASVFTGLRPEHHGLGAGLRSYLDAKALTLAERLRAAGYRTGCFTRNAFLSPEFGLTQGFDRVDPRYLIPDAPYPFAPATHAAALSWMLETHRAGRPFFVVINDMEAHYPYTPERRYESRFLPPGIPPAEVRAARDLPATALFSHNVGKALLAPEMLRTLSGLYDAEIAGMDDAIGTLLSRLRDAGLLDQTITGVLGDHGENLGDHGLTEHQFSLHRSVCHVPLILRYPPRVPPAVVTDVVRLEDLAPTILTLCGQPVPDDLDGATLTGDVSGRISRAILGRQDEVLRENSDATGIAVRARRRAAGIRAVFDGRYHLLVYSDGREELYDVPADPDELADLRPGADSGLLARLRTLLPSQ